MLPLLIFVVFFFFNDTATTEIYTLSLHDALPILKDLGRRLRVLQFDMGQTFELTDGWAREIGLPVRDRKSTRLNSSHLVISYAVFCLKKKKKIETTLTAHTPGFIETPETIPVHTL